MSDLISREALIEKLKMSIKWCEDNLESSTASFQSGCIATIKDVINTVKMKETCPSVDAVEVVRCKECKHKSTHNCRLYYGTTNFNDFFVDLGEDFYCSYGERKEAHDAET